MNIEVKPEDGNFAVTVSADSIDENLQVFGRANHYADDHMVATIPACRDQSRKTRPLVQPAHRTEEPRHARCPIVTATLT